MTVRELNRNQLDELKSSYFRTEDNEYMHPELIPDNVIFEFYGYINFVPDDFSCTKED